MQKQWVAAAVVVLPLHHRITQLRNATEHVLARKMMMMVMMVMMMMMMMLMMMMAIDKPTAQARFLCHHLHIDEVTLCTLCFCLLTKVADGIEPTSEAGKRGGGGGEEGLGS
jgi:hypothetical protein